MELFKKFNEGLKFQVRYPPKPPREVGGALRPKRSLKSIKYGNTSAQRLYVKFETKSFPQMEASPLSWRDWCLAWRGLVLGFQVSSWVETYVLLNLEEI